MVHRRQSAAGAESGQPQTDNTREQCVWLVEDDDQIRELIAAVLRSEGFEVVELCDGIEALNHLAVAVVFADEVRRPDLVVTDIRMPNFSGLDVLMGMRECEIRPPVMLITAVRDEEIHREARRLGAVEVLTKPFGVEAFLEAVDQAVDADGQPGPAAESEETVTATSPVPDVEV